MQIYLSRNGQRLGPYPVEEVNRQLAAGTVNPSDLGWSETSPGWKPLLSFAGVIVPGGASSSPVSLAIATPFHGHLREFGGFWIRTVALLIDAVILFAAVWLVALALPFNAEEGGSAPLVGALMQLGFALIYMPALWASAVQATLGQKLCRLQVVDEEGGRISFGRGVLRVLAMMLAGAIAGIGFMMAAFTERKRGLHDMIAGTCVVKEG